MQVYIIAISNKFFLKCNDQYNENKHILILYRNGCQE